jgi:hypothetical protein
MPAAPTAVLKRPDPAGDSGATRSVFRPLLVDAVLPLGAYFVARDGLGWSLVTAITLSSAITLTRSGYSLLHDRVINQLALLVLASNIAGLVFGLTTCDARFLIAKDSGVSSVVAAGILLSVARGRPMMSEGLMPFLTRGRAERVAALERLHRTPRWDRLERRYSLIWGGFLLADCVARLVGAYTITPSTMAWASTAILVSAIVLATVVSGAAAARPMTSMVDNAAALGSPTSPSGGRA